MEKLIRAESRHSHGNRGGGRGWDAEAEIDPSVSVWQAHRGRYGLRVCLSTPRGKDESPKDLGGDNRPGLALGSTENSLEVSDRGVSYSCEGWTIP